MTEIFVAVVGDDPDVLDPDPDFPRHVDAGLDRTTLPASSTSSERWPSRGASWTSTPTPWPSPWPKSSPWPSAEISSRATASTSLPVLPGPTASRRGLLCSLDQVVDLAGLPVGLARGEGPRSVRAVAVVDRAVVEDDELALADLAIDGRRRAGARRWGRRRRSTGTTARQPSSRIAAALAIARPRARCGRRAHPRARARRPRRRAAPPRASPPSRPRPSPAAGARRGPALGTRSTEPSSSSSSASKTFTLVCASSKPTRPPGARRPPASAAARPGRSRSRRAHRGRARCSGNR